MSSLRGSTLPATSTTTTTTTKAPNGSILLHVEPTDRRHSSFHPSPAPSPSHSRQGSESSQRKGSDPPAWLLAMNERNNSVSSAPESRKSSVVGDLKGLFGRKKTKDTAPKPKQVIYSKHAGVVRNTLKTDVRLDPSRRNSTGSTAQSETHPRSTIHMTAKEQEERHPHSGPVAHGSPLTTIVSRVDEEPEQQSIASALQSRDNLAHQLVPEVENKPTAFATEEESHARKKSVTDVEFHPGERVRRKSVFGGWYRDQAGKWTR